MPTPKKRVRTEKGWIVVDCYGRAIRVDDEMSVFWRKKAAYASELSKERIVRCTVSWEVED